MGGLKRKESLTHAITWMYLEDILLGRIRQTQKANLLLDSTSKR